jgi:hypothetical protein
MAEPSIPIVNADMATTPRLRLSYQLGGIQMADDLTDQTAQTAQVDPATE